MRNDFDDDVSTTNDALSVVCGWSVLFYALSLSLSCVCVFMCVYVCIYITTIRVPSFPLRSFPKGSRVQPKCGGEGHHENLKYEFMNSRVCLVSLISSLWFGVVVTFSSLLSFFGFLDVFFPKELPKRRHKVSFSFSRVLSWFFEHAHSICAQRRQTDTLRAERKRERVFGGRRRVFERETR